MILYEKNKIYNSLVELFYMIFIKQSDKDILKVSRMWKK